MSLIYNVQAKGIPSKFVLHHDTVYGYPHQEHRLLRFGLGETREFNPTGFTVIKTDYYTQKLKWMEFYPNHDLDERVPRLGTIAHVAVLDYVTQTFDDIQEWFVGHRFRMNQLRRDHLKNMGLDAGDITNHLSWPFFNIWQDFPTYFELSKEYLESLDVVLSRDFIQTN